MAIMRELETKGQKKALGNNAFLRGVLINFKSKSNILFPSKGGISCSLLETKVAADHHRGWQ